jgi:alkanesulfonate monooxygenase SsuD/methylene tetrahydromethanopterin reductase-like flavin-dependent oxidoreductase (luciferase family)
VDRSLNGVTVGVRLPNSGPFATADNLLTLGEDAERLGYDAVWVHDHISWAPSMLTHLGAGSLEACNGQDPNFFESVTAVAVLGARLKRVRVGIAGLVLPLRDPRVLAKQIATIEHLVGRGRLILACGIGNVANDFETMAVPWKRRGRITNDYLGALQAIMRGEQPVYFESDSATIANGHFYPRTDDLELWIAGGRAGGSDAALRRAARFANGWMTSATVDVYREAVAHLRELVREEQRDPDEVLPAIEIFACIASSFDEAVEISSRTFKARFPDGGLGVQSSLIGDVERVVDTMRAYAEAGVRHFELKFISHTPDHMRQMMERLASAGAWSSASAQAAPR